MNKSNTTTSTTSTHTSESIASDILKFLEAGNTIKVYNPSNELVREISLPEYLAGK